MTLKCPVGRFYRKWSTTSIMMYVSMHILTGMYVRKPMIGSRHNFYYKTAWNKFCNWTEL